MAGCRACVGGVRALAWSSFGAVTLLRGQRHRWRKDVGGNVRSAGLAARRLTVSPCVFSAPRRTTARPPVDVLPATLLRPEGVIARQCGQTRDGRGARGGTGGSWLRFAALPSRMRCAARPSLLTMHTGPRNASRAQYVAGEAEVASPASVPLPVAAGGVRVSVQTDLDFSSGCRPRSGVPRCLTATDDRATAPSIDPASKDLDDGASVAHLPVSGRLSPSAAAASDALLATLDGECAQQTAGVDASVVATSVARTLPTVSVVAVRPGPAESSSDFCGELDRAGAVVTGTGEGTSGRVFGGDATGTKDNNAVVKRSFSSEEEEEGTTIVHKRDGPVMFGNMPLSHWRNVPTFPEWCAYQESLPRDQRDWPDDVSSVGTPSQTSLSNV